MKGRTMNGFNRDTFVSADRETRDKMLFDMLGELYSVTKSLEARKWVNWALSLGGGVAGGFAGILTYWKFFKDAM